MDKLINKIYDIMLVENLGLKYPDEFKVLKTIHELNGIEESRTTKQKELSEYFNNYNGKEEEK